MRNDLQTLADDLSDAILTMLDLAPPTVRSPSEEDLSIDVLFDDASPVTLRMAR